MALIPGANLAAASGMKVPAGPPTLDEAVWFRIGECAGFRTQWALWEDTLVRQGTSLNPFIRLFKGVYGPLLLWNAQLNFYPEARAADIERFMSRCLVLCGNPQRRVMPGGVGVSRGPVGDPRNDWGFRDNEWVMLGAHGRLNVQICAHEPFSPRHDFRFQVALRIERPSSWRPAADGARL